MQKIANQDIEKTVEHELNRLERERLKAEIKKLEAEASQMHRQKLLHTVIIVLLIIAAKTTGIMAILGVIGVA